MKTASKVMYIIGTIWAIIGLILGIACVILGVVFLANGNLDIDEELKQTGGTTYLILGCVLSVIYLLVICLATKGRKALGNGKVNIAPHVIAIVFGAISFDICFVLAGIFGLVGESYGRH